MVTICTRLRHEPRVRALADAYKGVFYAAGTHPMSAAEEPLATLEGLLALTKHPKFVAFGETGLDYHYTADSRDVQHTSLRIHIAAARQSGLPLIIHSRDADDYMARILSQEHRQGAFGCVMHCFSSGPELARTAIDLVFYLSMSGIAAFPKSQALRDILPIARLSRCWWKPIPHILRRPPFVANATSPGMSYIPPARARPCLEWIWMRLPGRQAQILTDCLPRPQGAHYDRSTGLYNFGMRLIGWCATFGRTLGRVRPIRATQHPPPLFNAD